MFKKKFGKQVGYYHFGSLYCYLRGSLNSTNRIKPFLPNKRNVHYFSEARHAIFAVINQLKENNPQLKVAVPVWSCSIVCSILERAGVQVVLIDVGPSSLKMNIQDVKSVEPDVVILVAENGNIYSKEEVDILNAAGIVTIGDYSLAFQNYKIIRDLGCHFDVFSGGFSKPISSLGVGILCTNHRIKVPAKYIRKFSYIDFFKLIAHLLLQQPVIYSWVVQFLGDPRKEIFSPFGHNKVNWRHLDVLANELEKFKHTEGEWAEFQQVIQLQLGLSEEQPSVFLSKVLVPVEKIKKDNLIHFHRQYRWTTELNNDDSFLGMKCIQVDYLSVAINRTAFKNKVMFGNAIKNSLKL